MMETFILHTLRSHVGPRISLDLYLSQNTQQCICCNKKVEKEYHTTLNEIILSFFIRRATHRSHVFNFIMSKIHA